MEDLRTDLNIEIRPSLVELLVPWVYPIRVDMTLDQVQNEIVRENWTYFGKKMNRVKGAELHYRITWALGCSQAIAYGTTIGYLLKHLN